MTDDQIRTALDTLAARPPQRFRLADGTEGEWENSWTWLAPVVAESLPRLSPEMRREVETNVREALALVAA
jgi:hypothetical protein